MSKSKNTKQLKCVHCLRVPEEITFDHVIPKSWYSTIRSEKVTKPKAPSCFECNQKLGKLEKFLSHIMWMCMPETHPMHEELTEKVYRACGMNRDGSLLQGLDDEERFKRMNYAKKLLSSTKPANEIDESRLFPGFGFHTGYPKEIQRATLIPEKLIIEVATKVVRGIEYIQKGNFGRYIEPPYSLTVYFPRDPHEPSLEAVRSKCPPFSDGTNTIQRGADPQKPLEPIYIIRLWDQWEIWGIIVNEDGPNSTCSG